MSSSSEAIPSGTACPGVEELRAFVAGEASLGRMTHLIEHLYVQKCPRCTDLVLQLPDTTGSLFVSIDNRLPREGVPPLPSFDAPTLEGDTPGYHPTATTDLRGLRLGRYLVRGFIGKGGFGAVYEAFDERLGRRVAIKIPFEGGLTAQQCEEVAQEAQLHASLDHPHIVPIYDVGQSEGIPCFFVSKLIEGENLSARLDRGPLTRRQTAQIVRQIALALEHLREQGLVHRDVKPRNILLDRQETAFLVDFGLATRPVGPSESSARQVLAGTLPYMAPEQVRGDLSQIDHRTDIYALGVVLYELLTGVKPFEGEPSSLRQRIQTEPVVPPHIRQPGVPRELEAICLKALSREPAQRYARAAEFAEDLQAYLAGEPLRHALRINRAERTVRWLGRNRSQVGLALSVVVLILLLLWMMRREVDAAPFRWPTVLTTEPAGAELTYFPLDPETGEPQVHRPMMTQDGKQVLLAPGQYLVVAVLRSADGQVDRFHEVLRTVPGRGNATPGAFRHIVWKNQQGIIHLPVVRLPGADPSREMCLFPGAPAYETTTTRWRPGPNESASPDRSKCQIQMPPFYLDPTEVRAGDYLAWLTRNSEAKDVKQPLNPDLPATNVSWCHAAAYAEAMGKRLPDELEFEFAATGGGRWRFPWGDAEEPLTRMPWVMRPVGQWELDVVRVPGQRLAVYGLHSGAAEWMGTWGPSLQMGASRMLPSQVRAVRGAPMEVAEGKSQGALPTTFDARQVYYLNSDHIIGLELPGLSFRCARSPGPRLKPEDFIRRVRSGEAPAD